MRPFNCLPSLVALYLIKLVYVSDKCINYQ